MGWIWADGSPCGRQLQLCQALCGRDARGPSDTGVRAAKGGGISAMALLIMTPTGFKSEGDICFASFADRLHYSVSLLVVPSLGCHWGYCSS